MYSGVVVFGVVFEVRMFRVSWPVMSVKALTNPPVVPTGALKMRHLRIRFPEMLSQCTYICH